MRLTFWGTRGSLAKPGPDTLRYGGNTSCVQFESDSGTLIVIDCGTGAHELGIALLERPAPQHGNLLIGHTHWDHIQGIPFFGPLYQAGNRWDCYAPSGFGKSIEDVLAGQMEYTYFPIDMDALAADVRYQSLVEGVFAVGDVTVRTRYLNHPALTLGFRLEVDGVAVVYACDHEPHGPAAEHAAAIEGADRDHAEFLRDADLVVHDAQYTAEEYPGKVGWGHSTHEYAIAACLAAGVKRLALTHHDPLRTDDELERIHARLAAELERTDAPLELFMAAEGQSFELRSEAAASPSEGEPSALREAEPLASRPVLLALPPGAAGTDVIREALAEEELEAVAVATVDEFLQEQRRLHPALAIVGAAFASAGAEALVDASGRGAERSADHGTLDPAADTALLVIHEAGAPDPDDRENGRLRMPFSVQYARTRIRACLLRTPSRWIAPPLPEDETERQAALEGLCLLDTPREERFDQLTRLARALLDVPIALITLIDGDRQWFKAYEGTELRESTREASFCGHAILQEEALVVPDALQDDRFAENPAVLGALRVRFYLGQPLHAPSGHRIGSLCVIDTRPREPTPAQLTGLKDLARLVERELAV